MNKFQIGQVYRHGTSLTNLNLYLVLDIKQGYKEKVGGKVVYTDENADAILMKKLFDQITFIVNSRDYSAEGFSLVEGIEKRIIVKFIFKKE